MSAFREQDEKFFFGRQKFVDSLVEVVYRQNYPTFGAALQQHKPQLLGAMNRAEMQEAIERPAEEMGVKLEEGLTERILDAVKREPGNLPLLEFALEQLWARQKNNRLTHDAYDDIKGVEKALAVYAQSVYEELTQKIDGKQIQQIFIQLVRVGQGTEDTRQLATRAEVGGDNWDLVKQLADKRLVVTGRNEATGEETVEVVHEALIREWSLLRQWIDQNRKKLIQKREIEDAAKRWRDRGKAKDYLLGGKVLTEAKVFEEQEGGNLRLSDLGKEFIGQSLKRRRNDRFSIGLYWIIIFILLSLVTLGGTIVATQIKLSQLWAIVNREKIDSPARIKALQDLVKLVKANNNFGGIVRIDLSYVNLRNVDFSGVDLSHAILLNADLSSANLSGTILSRTNLINANLSGADLTDTDLTDASLSNTNLTNANLSGADLTDADLSHSKFFGSNLSGANLGGANLSSADLSGTDFSNADLSGANLSGADLKGTNFSNTDLSDANLSHVKFHLIMIVYSGERKRLISKAEEESYLRLKQESESTDLGRGVPKHRNAIILVNKNVNLDNANLDNANLRGAKNLTPEQVKSAKNWQQAIYDEEFRKKLGLK